MFHATHTLDESDLTLGGLVAAPFRWFIQLPKRLWAHFVEIFKGIEGYGPIAGRFVAVMAFLWLPVRAVFVALTLVVLLAAALVIIPELLLWLACEKIGSLCSDAFRREVTNV